jgi:hypothetical protein
MLFQFTFYVEIHSCKNPRMIGRVWFTRRNFRPNRRYESNLWFTLKFVLIYVVLVYVLRGNPPEPKTRTIGGMRFSRRNFWAHSPLQNRSMVYTKISNHLRCFGPRFTLEYVWARTRTYTPRGYTWLGLPSTDTHTHTTY